MVSASLNVAILGELAASRAEAAQSLGKKGSVDDLGFYHTVFQGKIVSVIDPVSYPAKLSCMLQALNLSDHALILADSATPVLGEIILALDFLGKGAAFVSRLDLKPFLAGTSLEGSSVFGDVAEAKPFILGQESHGLEGDAEILVDHCFEVKGVGTVVLGLLRSGKVAVHDRLKAHPLGREIEVKSIQKNDQDFKEAIAGDRVGLCIKGATSQEMGRGTVLSGNGCSEAREVQCEVSVSKFSRSALANGAAVQALVGLQFEPARIELGTAMGPGQQGKARLVFEKPVAFKNGERVLLCDLNAKGNRIVAGGLISPALQPRSP
jgi:selenocysteine-specific translation elongation factor